VRRNIENNNGNAHLGRVAKRCLVGINCAEFMDMARQAIPEGRQDTRDEEDKAGSEGAFGPGLKRERDCLASNLGWREPGSADIEE
jgi:hypothetical protein